MTDFLIAMFLGFVEGLTEFIPVSSTGHLVLLVQATGFHAPPGHVFEVFIQLGAIFAVVVLYRRKIAQTIAGLRSDPVAQKFTMNLIAVSVPAVIAGALGHAFIKGLYTAPVIATALIIGGVIILFLERRFAAAQVHSVDEIPLKTALLIGCFQAIALVPGVSRSGATIMGALFLGLSRPVAAEFSFFAAIPVMCGAVLFDVLKNRAALMQADNISLLAAGFLAAFITALIVLKVALHIVSRWGFQPFAWYRIAAGIVIFALMAGF